MQFKRCPQITSLVALCLTAVSCDRQKNTPVVTVVISNPRECIFQITNAPGTANPIRTAEGNYVLRIDLSKPIFYDAAKYPHGQWVKMRANTDDGKPVSADLVIPGSAFEVAIVSTDSDGNIQAKMTEIKK